MVRGCGILIAPIVELILLRRAEKGWFDVLALFTFGYSIVSLHFFVGLAVTKETNKKGEGRKDQISRSNSKINATAATTTTQDIYDDENNNEYDKNMRMAFAIASTIVVITARIVLLIWYPFQGITMPASYDDYSTHFKIISTLICIYCLRNGLDAVIVSAHIDPLTCRLHLVSILFAGPIAALTLSYVCVVCCNEKRAS